MSKYSIASKYAFKYAFKYGDKWALRRAKNISFVSFEADCLEVMHSIAASKTSTGHLTCLHGAMLSSTAKIIKVYCILLCMLTFQFAYNNKKKIFILVFCKTKGGAIILCVFLIVHLLQILFESVI